MNPLSIHGHLGSVTGHAPASRGSPMAVVCRVDRRLRPGAAGRRGAAHPAGGQGQGLGSAGGGESGAWKGAGHLEV